MKSCSIEVQDGVQELKTELLRRATSNPGFDHAACHTDRLKGSEGKLFQVLVGSLRSGELWWCSIHFGTITSVIAHIRREVQTGPKLESVFFFFKQACNVCSFMGTLKMTA